MLDFFNLPIDKGVADVQMFTTPSTVTNIQWNTWIKPRGKSMMHITCIGGGGGGGGGFTGSSGTARGGGGSGGSSSISRVTIPLIFVPDVLFVQVGAGGLGKSSGGGTGGSGIVSAVNINTNGVSTNLIILSGAVGAGGGVTGTVGAGGTGGASGTIATIGAMPLCGSGFSDFIAGQIGVAGGAQTGAVGTSQIIPLTSCLTTAGSGGAGTTSVDFAGGGWTSIAGSWLSEQLPATPSAGSNAGSGGFPLWKPMFFFGGTGGSSSNAGIGGNGGNGSYGCGGGGGGGGTTGGKGGDGGQGIVIITCW